MTNVHIATLVLIEPESCTCIRTLCTLIIRDYLVQIKHIKTLKPKTSDNLLERYK